MGNKEIPKSIDKKIIAKACSLSPKEQTSKTKLLDYNHFIAAKHQTKKSWPHPMTPTDWLWNLDFGTCKAAIRQFNISTGMMSERQRISSLLDGNKVTALSSLHQNSVKGGLEEGWNIYHAHSHHDASGAQRGLETPTPPSSNEKPPCP